MKVSDERLRELRGKLQRYANLGREAYIPSEEVDYLIATIDELKERRALDEKQGGYAMIRTGDNVA